MGFFFSINYKKAKYHYINMKVLLPNTNSQTISIIPRNITSTDVVTINLSKDGEKTSETISDVVPVINGNFVELSFASTIYKEGHSYFVECYQGANLYYRDKIYVTAKTDFTVKHKQTQENYTEYNTVDDNTYIIR